MVKKVFLFLVFTAAFLQAQQISVKVKTDLKDYRVGDLISYTAEITHPKGALFFPVVPDSLPEMLDLVSVDSLRRDDAGTMAKTVYAFTFAGFDSGDVFIPAFHLPFSVPADSFQWGKSPVVQRKDTVLLAAITDSVLITVHTVDVDTSKAFIDIKDVVELPYDWGSIVPYILIALAVLVAGIIAFYLWKKKRKKSPKPEPEIVLTPKQRALAAIAKLEAEQLWQKGEIKEFHSRITEIIRTLFEETYAIPALESTTGETLELLRNAGADQQVVTTTSQFLSNADMVKFAKFIPDEKINTQMIEQSRTITAQVPDTSKEHPDA